MESTPEAPDPVSPGDNDDESNGPDTLSDPASPEVSHDPENTDQGDDKEFKQIGKEQEDDFDGPNESQAPENVTQEATGQNVNTGTGDQNNFHISDGLNFEELQEIISFNLARHEVSLEELQEDIASYLSIPEFSEIQTGLATSGIAFVAGIAGIGKRTQIKYFAAKALHKKAGGKFYSLHDSINVPLRLIWKDLPDNSIVMVTDAFLNPDPNARSIARQTIAKSKIKATWKELKDRSIKLIFTTTVPKSGLREKVRHLQRKPLVLEITDWPSHRALIEAYWLRKKGNLTLKSTFASFYESAKDDILTLKTPQQIVQLVNYVIDYFVRAAQDSESGIEQDIKRETKRILDSSGEVKYFFDSLDREVQMMSLVVALFGGCFEREARFYFQSLLQMEQLTESEGTPDSLFDRKPSRTLYAEASLRIVSEEIDTGIGKARNNYLDFSDPGQGPKILRYAKENHPYYLELFIDFFIRFLRESFEYFEQRIHVAYALGKIAGINWPRVFQFILECTNSEETGKKNLAAYMLSEALFEPMTHKLALDQVARWRAQLTHTRFQGKNWVAINIWKEVILKNPEGQFTDFAFGQIMGFMRDIDPGSNQLLFNSLGYSLNVLCIRGEYVEVVNRLYQLADEIWPNQTTERHKYPSLPKASWVTLANLYDYWTEMTKNFIRWERKKRFPDKNGLFAALAIDTQDVPFNRLTFILIQFAAIGSDLNLGKRKSNIEVFKIVRLIQKIKSEISSELAQKFSEHLLALSRDGLAGPGTWMGKYLHFALTANFTNN